MGSPLYALKIAVPLSSIPRPASNRWVFRRQRALHNKRHGPARDGKPWSALALTTALAGRGCRGLSPEERRPLSPPNPSRQVCTYHQAAPSGSATAVAGAFEPMHHAQTARCSAATTLGSSTYQPPRATGLTVPRFGTRPRSSLGPAPLTRRQNRAILEQTSARPSSALQAVARQLTESRGR